MADVIRIQERMPRGPRKCVQQPVDAKILLFTGVRYEPMEKIGRVTFDESGEKVTH